MSDHRRAAAIVGSHGRAVIGRRNGGRTGDSNVGRDAADHRTRVIVDGERLDEAAAIAAHIGGGVGPLYDKLIGARSWYGLIAVCDYRYTSASIRGNDCAIVGRRHGAGALDRD